MNYLFGILILQIFLHVSQAQDTYKAAVIEYATKKSAPSYKDRVLENVLEYVEYIQNAADKHVDIIVFPENGLTGMDINVNNIEEMSTEVPNPAQSISPCKSTGNFSKALIDLSCAAETHRMYVVVNLIEILQHNSTGKIYHNTNVVLNREGVVIVRFRKINLFNESYMTPDNETVTFKTDFGVTFGIFTCNDILFKRPSLDILKDNSVTDIIYPTAWFSEIPFLGALSVQHGYATSNGVNLLASGYDDPPSNNGGSGIYLANGKVVDVYISGGKSSKMIIADVPRSTRRKDTDSCQKSTNPPDAFGTRFVIGGGMMPDISSFKTIQENMINYTFKSLNLNKSDIVESACSNQDSCCFVNMTISRTNVDLNYIYKLVVFDGGRYLSTESIGSRSCGLIACLNDSNQSCGDRINQPPNGIVFETISLKGLFKNIQNAQDRPATLNYNLEPVHNYTFCKKNLNETSVEVTLYTEKQSNLLTFGIFGRVFDNDNKGTGAFNSAAFNLLSPYIVFFISIVVFLLQD